jgi:asparagine synthase (glutamine-hydrolysing)
MGRKRLLRQAARTILPPGFADAPKSGFAVPVGAWFRSNFAGLRTLLHARVLRPDAFASFSQHVPFNAGRIEAMIAEHDQRVMDHSQRLYHLLVLSIWSDWLRSA